MKEKAKTSVDKNLFVEEYCANGKNGVQAIIAAGFAGSYASARVAAHRLITNDNIIHKIESRMAEIRGEMQTEYSLTRKRQCEKLQKIANEAVKNNQFSAAVKALSDQSRICGLYEVDNTQKKPSTLAELLLSISEKEKAKIPKPIESHIVSEQDNP